MSFDWIIDIIMFSWVYVRGASNWDSAGYWRDLQAKVFFQDLHLHLGFYDPLRETIFLSLV